MFHLETSSAEPELCSPGRRFLLQIHTDYCWCCQQLARPIIALLNTVDETPRFASYLLATTEGS